jgi:hypothetical protein
VQTFDQCKIKRSGAGTRLREWLWGNNAQVKVLVRRRLRDYLGVVGNGFRAGSHG